ncbi:MAG: sugar phosphate isomerase/epimerase [Deltaproteobacteria bacterium]|jgi:hexulose-6-phosphate isomerase|nr:sugar phosphate isomerase/epimerase [Deltaproteobacteria bacterium]
MKPNNNIGIMQGRLSPKVPEHLQSFPINEWREEFFRAAALGFQYIEWLVDDYKLDVNPLFQPEGVCEIKSLVSTTGIEVESLCAHLFMDGALLGRQGARPLHEAKQVLERLIAATEYIGIKTLIIPMMDAARLNDQRDFNLLKENLHTVDISKCSLALELDLDADNSLALIEYLDSDTVGLCYDLGNATAFGYYPPAELPVLMPFIREIHIKDRLINGGSRCLGDGATPVNECLHIACDLGYTGSYILETPVEDDWLRCAEHNFKFIETILGEPR